MDDFIGSSTFFVLVVVVLAFVAFAAIWWFGTKLARTNPPLVNDAQLDKIIAYLTETQQKKNPLWHLVNANADSLQRRNEYMTTFAQTIAAVFIVVVIAVLLLAEVIDSAAGLPILSAISGVVIAKSVSGNRSSGVQD